MTADTGVFLDSRFARLLGTTGAAELATRAQPFFARQRGPEELARLFAVFRVGEHHAVITIGDWLKSTNRLDVQDGYARLVWDEARHTRTWTQRMIELIGEPRVERWYPDPRRVAVEHPEYFRLWDEYGKADSLAKQLAYIYLVDAWAGFAYTAYMSFVDPVTRWHLQTILADEGFHVSFGQHMASMYVTSEREKETLAREEEKIIGILANVTDGFLHGDG
jgi:1,2-phenylacetyl-CoA epoxidase catalytic subunit